MQAALANCSSSMWQGKKVYRELVSWFPVPERGCINSRSGFELFCVVKRGDSRSVKHARMHIYTRRRAMRKIRLVVMTLLSLALALPAFGKTSKNTYPAACSELWGAVKDVLGNAENYNVEESNDTLMTAAYKVKHNVHVTVTGAVLQRTNHVALVSKGAQCEMQVKSNYSGFEHDDS